MGDPIKSIHLPRIILMDRVAVLASGGLDSSILVADIARDSIVFPIYVQVGLAWENEERKALTSFLDALNSPNVQPLTVLSLPIQPLYQDHWSVTGLGVPASDEPDSAVFLPGRNILLIGLVSVWCSTHDVSKIAIGLLAGNPFPDATPEFFDAFESALSQGLAHRIDIQLPYRGLHKEDIIRRFSYLPLELTVTCMAPGGGAHCGGCNKCAERRLAFEGAGVTDPTRYAKVPGN